MVIMLLQEKENPWELIEIYFRDILIEDGMDEDSVDDIMKKLEKSKEESTRTTLSQEEMRKKYLGE